MQTRTEDRIMLVLAILHPHALLLQSSRHAPHRHGGCAMLIDTPAAVLTRCALQRSSPAEDVQSTLEELERTQSTEPAAVSDFDGRWELVWSSAATKLPLLNGYMPNRELLSWDLQAAQLRLKIETLPFLPKISIVGQGLAFDEVAPLDLRKVNNSLADWFAWFYYRKDLADF